MRTILILSHVLIVVAGCRQTGSMNLQGERSAFVRRIHPQGGKTIGPYSPAVRVGDFLFVSGQIAINPLNGELLDGDIEAETRQTLENIARILSAESCRMSNIVSVTVYLKRIGDFERMNRIYAGFFAEGNYPARTTVEVSDLPRNANIEIAVIAYQEQRK